MGMARAQHRPASRGVWGRAAGLAAAGLAIAGLLGGATAASAAGIGQPVPWQMDLQQPVTEVATEIYNFHHLLNWIMLVIVLFVLGLLIYCIVRFNERAQPTPSRTTHNTTLEVAWTIVPVLILVAIAIPSFRVLRTQLSDPRADLMVKVIGHAWYWSYEYPEDVGGFKFDANLLEGEDQVKSGQPKLLATDNEVVVPVNKIVKVQVTAADVLHSWALPSFGFKIDAIPGRLNQFWFKAEREGTYHGQCSELCGQRHAYMPITVKVVSQEAFQAWTAEAKTKFARTDGASRFADAR
ncbi:Cytochrome c oxidase subunit 2 [Methylobacterium crusticola]|uniref:Cytochrome c oxidase subunit 2 n=1 Tax=Methylobacterium crusticola TaxID=1697972 RepID=A0ABQ4QZ95_9HYPH|nr:cytochrome c oxidase subunit II [Methylobacterium crusticola]GJD50638.1 Cytochrome c oxidase subunit 2 [Methylobacterium crusticola]